MPAFTWNENGSLEPGLKLFTDTVNQNTPVRIRQSEYAEFSNDSIDMVQLLSTKGRGGETKTILVEGVATDLAAIRRIRLEFVFVCGPMNVANCRLEVGHVANSIRQAMDGPNADCSRSIYHQHRTRCHKPR